MLANHSPTTAQGYAMPDWEAIWDEVEAEHPPEAWHEVWCEIAREWMATVRDRLGGNYAIRESKNFLLVSTASEQKAVEVLQFLERIHARIQQTIPALLPEALYGQCPVLAFTDENDFYDYVSGYFDDDGEFGAMGGVYLNRGYGHFALPSPQLDHYAAVMSHELCHSFLSHLPLPLWLDEAITQGVEHSITGALPYVLDREIIRRHRDYWDEKLLQSFWTGDSFGFPDDGQELSYHLARFILHSLHQGGTTPREEMDRFFLTATYEDAGQSAAQEVFGISLGECLVPLLGEGNWDPVSPPEAVEFPGSS
ncbi:hypothetical protein OKA05_22915 [Luteolibacter arcticus]|uniref:DUF1570 domain-containing protein n=1 Tax=Luteolibacter arcticus TaxID=1581411 RepID=A0ABT3GPI3_9BACT|nr:hypothetical protein [Luteolibacter arcticus]MCW1925431.1 hypothetical protein [Luteolibacter arcticus]